MTTLFISHSSKDKQWAEQIRKALRKHGYQSLFLDFHPDDGIHAGADWERTLWLRLRQSRGLLVLCTANWLTSPWCIAEAMMARQSGKPIFTLASADIADGRQGKRAQNIAGIPQIPDFLKDTQFISLAHTTVRGAYRSLRRGLAEEGLKDDFPLPQRPYPGLNTFQETDAAVFFGRDDEIARIRDVLNRRWRGNARGFILVLGASGCGKSSLVRAGVSSRLKRARDSEGSRGRWIVLPPLTAGKGLEALANSLIFAFDEAKQPQANGRVRGLLGTARKGERGTKVAASALRKLADELLVARRAPDGLVLLVLDQLEEVFGTIDGSDARALLRLLLEVSADNASPVVILATMRSDFLNAFQLFPGAAERYEDIPLDPVPRQRFGELIEGPAGRFGLRLGAGLTERLAEDTRYDDALPLLTFTMERLYTKCEVKGTITVQDYEELFPAVSVHNENGRNIKYRGVSAAIKIVAESLLADAAYTDLHPDDPKMRDLRTAFLSLARVGEEGGVTRRTARWSQLPVSSRGVLQRFVSERLLISGLEGGRPSLNVAHEAIFRVWDTLREWLIKHRKALTLRSQTETAAAEFHSENQAESRKWSEERILDTVRDIEQSGVLLEDVARPEVIRSFLGPTDAVEILRLLTLTSANDRVAGSGRYGNVWRLPLATVARASAGLRLALLGDPRSGVGVGSDGLPCLRWARIPGTKAARSAGQFPAFTTFRLGNGMRMDPEGDSDEDWPREAGAVEVDTFDLSVYLTTVAQFRPFVECGGYREPRYWSKPSGQSRTDGPVWWGSKDWTFPNYPVVGVTWYAAEAYCNWLSEQLRLPWGTIRLPTEAEWEWTSRGPDGRRFPWGNQWDASFCNSLEKGIQRTCAVGMFPLGAADWWQAIQPDSPPVLDLTGNVLEWTASEYSEDYSTSDQIALNSDHPLDRQCILRGGGWDYEPKRVRCSARHKFPPHFFSLTRGFRIARNQER